MSRFHLVYGLIWVLLVSAAPCAMAQPRSPSTPPNVVLILADDLGWSDLGCYGADVHETPNLDRLAGQGVRFTDAYAASICSPTRASLLTGKHYARLKMTIWREGSLRPAAEASTKLIPAASAHDLPYEEITMAEMLKGAGYETALVGKWHLGDAHYYPETQGFDLNVGGTLWGAPQTYFYPYKGQGRFSNEFRYVPHLEHGKPGEYLTDRLTDEALKFIDNSASKPFFLYLAHHAPHTPLEAPAELVSHYEKKVSPQTKHRHPKYAAMVHSLDESVGRIMTHLDKLGLTKNTILIFLSDNGGYIAESDGVRITDNAPLRSGKGSLYEGGVRVPLIVRAPGVALAGRECHEPVFVGDLFPTIAELTGTALDPSHLARLDGKNLTSLLKSPDSKLDRDALYFHYPHYYATTTPASAVRQRDWKLLEYFEDHHVELYRLQDDLSESRDLATKHPEQVARLSKLLKDWRQEVGARLPAENPHYKPKP